MAERRDGRLMICPACRARSRMVAAGGCRTVPAVVGADDPAGNTCKVVVIRGVLTAVLSTRS